MVETGRIWNLSKPLYMSSFVASIKGCDQDSQETRGGTVSCHYNPLGIPVATETRDLIELPETLLQLFSHPDNGTNKI